MTVKDLRALASERQIPGRSAATRKADLIILILEHQEAIGDTEVKSSPAMSDPGDDGSDQLPNPPGVVPGARRYPGISNHVSLWRFYPPTNPPTLPGRFLVPPLEVIYTLGDFHSKTTLYLPRAPP